MFRTPKTTNEARFVSDPEYAKYARAKRKFKNLPNAWDDMFEHNEKCWKRHRKTQYKRK